MPRVSFRKATKLGASSVPSMEERMLSCGFDLVLTGGGARVVCLSSGTSSFGSGGRFILRCGFGERTEGVSLGVEGAGERTGGVAVRLCSNILTSEVVGAMGVSSVGFPSPPDADNPGFRASSLSNTLPTLPSGGSISASLGSLPAMMVGIGAGWPAALDALCLAAASLAAMLEGEGPRSTEWSSGSVKALDAGELLSWRTGDTLGLELRALPPVLSAPSGVAALEDVLVFRGVPVPTLVAASRAPLPPPVYRFVCGLGFRGGFEKASEAPRRAAFGTLYCVLFLFLLLLLLLLLLSPVDCGPT